MRPAPTNAMQLRDSLYRLATLTGLLATVTIASAQPVSRFVLGTYFNSTIAYAPHIIADSAGNSYLAGAASSGLSCPLHDGGSPVTLTVHFSKITSSGQGVFDLNLQGGAVTGMTMGPSGDVYIIGVPINTTVSYPDCTIFVNAIQPTPGALSVTNPAGFVARCTAAGNLVFVATFAADPAGVAVDATGAIYLTGTHAQLAATPSSFQPTQNSFSAFVAKLSPDGSLMTYATYLGGSLTDYGLAIAVDATGAMYIAGVAGSPDFPQSPAPGPPPTGPQHVFVSKLDPSGSNLLYSRVLGGSGAETPAALASTRMGRPTSTAVPTRPIFR